MRDRVLSFDWSQTPLGPIASWPPALRTAVDICLNSPTPMFVWWGPHLINIYNDVYAPVLGNRHPSALGQPARTIWSDIWPDIGPDVDRVVLHGQSVSKQRVRFIMERNGYPEETYFSYSHSPIPDGHGGIGGLFQVCTDETAQVRAEAARREIEDRHETVLDALAEGVTVHDENGVIVMANPSAQRILGLTLEQLCGRDSFDPRWRAVTEDGADFPPHLHPPQVVIRTGQPVRNLVFGIHRGDGSLVWVSANGVPLLHPTTGRVTGCTCSFFDVTDRLEAQHAADDLRRKLDAALLAGDVGTFEWDVTRDRLWGDRNFQHIFGIPLDDGIAAPVGRYVAAIHPDDQARVVEQVKRTVETGEPYVAEYRVIVGDQTRWVVGRGTGVRDASGRVARFPGVIVDVTDRKRAEEELRAQAVVTETVTSNAAEALYLLDADGAVTYANPSAEAMFGWTRAEMVGRKFHDLTHRTCTDGTPFPISDCRVGRCLASGQTLRNHQDLFIHKDGSSVVVLCSMAPLRDGAGRITGAVLAVSDVTDQHRAAGERERLLAELASERSRLADIIERAPAFMATLRGPDHVFEIVNERYYEVVGRRDLIGKPVRDALPEIADQGFIELLDDVYRTGRTFTGAEMPAMLRRGAGGTLERRYINVVYQATRGADGTISGIFAHGIDVTDLVLAREAARTSEERRALSIEAGDLGTFYCPMPLGRIEWNAKCKEHFWLPPDADVDFDRFYSIIHPDDRQRTREAVERAVFGHAPYDVEYRTVAPDGRTRWVRAKGRAYYDAAGNPTRFDGITIDVTDQKLAEADRQELLNRERAARADAESANHAKDRFLAVLSHELRTPLTPVAIAVTAMEMDPRLPFEFREDVAMVRRNVELETRLIDDLLDLNRVISGKLPLDRQPTSLHAVVRNVLQTVGAELHEKRLTVLTDLTATNDSVDGDAARLQQVLWNLLKNAAKFTPEGGTIRVRTYEDQPGRVAVEVSDTGRGIAPDALRTVFEPFEQGDAGVTRQFGGMGLGLAIAKGVVDLHGGTIRADSPGPGHGATFIVSLPTRPAGQAAPRHPAAAAPANGQRALRLLLVEDHADTAKTLARLLRLDGMDVHWAGTVSDALELARAIEFDLIVSDLGLPDGSGIDFLRQLRRASDATPAIAMSGYGMDEDLRQTRQAGFTEHLVKPINVPQLRQAIRRATANP